MNRSSNAKFDGSLHSVRLGSIVALSAWVAVLLVFAYTSIRDTRARAASEIHFLLSGEHQALNEGRLDSVIEGLRHAPSGAHVTVLKNGVELFSTGPNSLLTVCAREQINIDNAPIEIAGCRSPFPISKVALLLALLGLGLLSAFFALTLVYHGRLYRAAISQIVAQAGLQLSKIPTALEIRNEIDKLLADLANARRAESEMAGLAVVGRMAQVLAHDVRKPLTVLKLSLPRVTAAVDAGPEMVMSELARLQTVLAKTDVQIRGMVDEMLMSSGQLILTREPIHLRDLVDEIVSEECAVRGSSLSAVEIDVSSSCGVLADNAKLRRLLTNLIDNALTAADGKRVWVSAREAENERGGISIAVGNLGKHIAPEKLGILFEPFYTEGKVGGTGLGLFICKRIVEAHESKLMVSSNGIDGTKFSFVLERSEVIRTPVPQEIVSQCKVERILVVDDDPFISDGWAEACRSSIVEIFESSADCLGFLTGLSEAELSRTAAIVDYYLDASDSLNGAELAGEIRTKFGIPVVISTELDASRVAAPCGVRVIDKMPRTLEALRPMFA